MRVLLGRGAALGCVVLRARRRGGRSALAGARVAPLQRPEAPRRRRSDATATRAAMEPPHDAGADESPAAARAYQWAVHTATGVMGVTFLKPTWANASIAFALNRAGFVLLEFAPPSSSGERQQYNRDQQYHWDLRYDQDQQQYDWGDKIALALSAIELAQIFADPNAEHSFLRYPSTMDPSANGSTTKSLRWAPAPGGKAYFLSASLGGSAQGAAESGVSLTLTKADFYVFEALGRFAMPHLLGKDMHGVDLGLGRGSSLQHRGLGNGRPAAR